jgi:hypothetical protein
MPSKNNSYINEDAIGMGSLLAGLMVLSYIFLYVWPGNFGDKPHNCVELPNGLLVALAPNPRPHGRRGSQIRILKEPDGKVIVPAPSQSLTITQTTVFGRAGPTVDREELYSFAYRPDTGLVLESKNPELLARVVEAAGRQIWLGNKRSWVSSHSAYSDGLNHPKYWRTDCPANKFP